MALMDYAEFRRKVAESQPDKFEKLSRRQLERYRDYFAQSLKKPDPMGTTRETAQSQIDLLKPEIAERRRIEHNFHLKVLAVASLCVGIVAIIQRCADRQIPTPTPSLAGTPLPTSQKPQISPLQSAPTPTANVEIATPTAEPSQTPQKLPPPAP